MLFEIWEGDMFLYYVETQYEADEHIESGFIVKEVDHA